MQNSRYNHEEAIVNLNKIKVQPQDQISIVVSCKEPEVAALFNLLVANNRLGTGSSGSNNSGQIASYTVNGQGDINFPVLGKIHVAGLTRQEIGDYISKRLIDEGYVTDPIVTVEFGNLHFSVVGEVTGPGVYSINNDQVTLFEAIAMAGDLTIYGDRNVTVIREKDGKRTKYQVDLRDDSLFNSPAYYIQQNDVVYVEPNSVRAGQSTVNENNFKSVSLWISLASFLTTIAVLIFK